MTKQIDIKELIPFMKDGWGIIGISSSGAVVSKNMYHLEKYTYLGKSKVKIEDLFKTENE